MDRPGLVVGRAVVMRACWPGPSRRTTSPRQWQRQEPGGPVPAERPDEAQGGEDGEAADRGGAPESLACQFCFLRIKKTIQFPFTKTFPSVIPGIPSRCPARTLPARTLPGGWGPVVTFAVRKRAPGWHFGNPRPPWPPWPASPSSPSKACRFLRSYPSRFGKSMALRRRTNPLARPWRL